MHEKIKKTRNLGFQEFASQPRREPLSFQHQRHFNWNIVGKNADSFYQENESLAKLSLLTLLSQSPPVAKLSQKTEKVVKKHLILFSFNNFKFKSEFCML